MRCRDSAGLEHNRPGFSLIELSMVLVVIGLLVGGVVTGQSLLRASQIRGVLKEYETYFTASSTFKDKYAGLPGDLGNATQYFAYQGGAGCTNNTGATSTTLGVCDGNGNGLIEYTNTVSRPSEAFQGWRHLSAAGLIQGSYSGIAGPTLLAAFTAHGGGALDYILGTNAPRSRFPNVGWSMSYNDNTTNWRVFVPAINLLNWFVVGLDDDSMTDDPFLKPEEAYSIDAKIDDGMPWTGDVVTISSCLNGTSPAGYELTKSDTLCSLFFRGP